MVPFSRSPKTNRSRRLKSKDNTVVLQESRRNPLIFFALWTVTILFGLPDRMASSKLCCSIDLYSSICERISPTKFEFLLTNEVRKRNRQTTIHRDRGVFIALRSTAEAFLFSFRWFPAKLRFLTDATANALSMLYLIHT